MNKLSQYAVFGNPIKHSKSPALHMAFAEQTDQLINYEAMQVPLNEFKQAADRFFNEGGKGLNITVPFKEDAFHYATNLTNRAEQAGAVNTLIAHTDGSTLGDNTDGVGMVTDITQNLNWAIKDKKVLVLGAGGAVRGVLGPLIDKRPESIVIANRTLSKAEVLADYFKGFFEAISACAYEDLADQGFDLIINGTSASLNNDLPPLPDGLSNNGCACYDMMYAKSLTPFLLWAKDQGVEKLSDGLGMLVCQGAESFYQWRGLKPDTKPVIDKLREQ